jgi:hypothetical protein
MIRFFKSLQPATLIIIPFIIFIFWVRNALHFSPVTDEGSLPLWDLIAGVFRAFPAWLNFIVVYLLVSGQAVYLNLMLNRNEVLYKNSFLPSLIFALFISSTPALMVFHPVLIINILMIMILDRLFSLFKSVTPRAILFDCGFLSGIAALIYFPSILFLPFLLSSMYVIRSFKFKEWMIIIISFCVPFFLFSTYLFWNHSLTQFWHPYMARFGNTYTEFVLPNGHAFIALCSAIGFLFFLSLLKLRANYRKNVIRTRNYQQVFLFYLIIGIAWLFFSGRVEVIHFAFLLIPVSVFSSYYFLSAKRRLMLYEYALWGLIGIIVWNHLS